MSISTEDGMKVNVEIFSGITLPIRVVAFIQSEAEPSSNLIAQTQVSFLIYGFVIFLDKIEETTVLFDWFAIVIFVLKCYCIISLK